MRNKKGQFVKTHDLSRHRIYSIYCGMMSRCNREANSNFNRYGGRGITVCDRWYYDFVAFVEDIGLPPTKFHQLDRKNNDKGYYLSNCRWRTPKENANNKSNCHLITYKGKTQSLTLWAEELGVPRARLYQRINQAGWSIKHAFTKPKSERLNR